MALNSNAIGKLSQGNGDNMPFAFMRSLKPTHTHKHTELSMIRFQSTLKAIDPGNRKK